MARKLEVLIVGDASSLEKALGSAKTSAGGFGDGLAKASKFASVGLLGAAVAAKKFSDDASGLNESINATNVVFGDAAGKVQAFSKVAGKEAGLSMRSFNELVTPVGASLRNVGFSADKAATSSISLAKRAADMASVFNVDVKDALGAIQAGLRGEADPLERFGVGLSDAAVKAQAMSMGLAKTEAGLSANDKAQARLALLMKQTDKVAGDFKKTSGELANSQRINAAEAENQRAKFGQGLLPAMQALQGVQRKLTTFMGEHSTATKAGTLAAVALMAAVVAVNGAVKVYQATLVAAKAAQVIFNATMAMNPIGLVVIALVALGAGLVIAYKKSETFRDIVNGVFNAVRNAVATAIQFMLGLFDRYLGGIQAILTAASKLPFVGDKFRGLADSVGSAREKVRELQSSMDGLKSKSITISTTIERVYKERSETLPGSPIGRRAHGGPVKRGLPYLVGEKGPEIMWPSMAGRIIPNISRGLSAASSALALPTGGGATTALAGAGGSHVAPGGWGTGDIVVKLGESEIARAVRKDKTSHERVNGRGSW